MPYVTVGKENAAKIELYYEDHGSGKPVVLIHGWPLSGASWEKQLTALLDAGYRVITYDRRGFGRSSQPTFGYDYDTFASDLDKLMTKLRLHDAALVGFSMGTGEVARYLATFGSKRVERAVFLASVPPFLLKADDNPDGVDFDLFDGIMKAIAADRPAYLSAFLASFYNTDVFLGKRISEDVVRAHWNIAAAASPKGTLDCVKSWLTDFRKDLPLIDIPSMIVHGDSDRILPFSVTAARLQYAIKGARLVVVEGGCHGLIWTHADVINRALLDFLGEAAGKRHEAEPLATPVSAH